MKTRMRTLIISAFMTVTMTVTAFAGTWVQDAKGWWWDNGNGTRPTNTWQWCEGDGDGVAECYYFDGNGYCLMDTTTPDGYTVNKDGAWIVNGVVQTQKITAQTGSVAVANNAIDRLYYLKMYYGLPGETQEQKEAKMYHVIYDLHRSYGDMEDRPLTYAAITEFLNNTDWPNMSEYEKAKAVYDRVGNGYHGNYYAWPSASNENIYEWPVFAYKHGVCANYARAYVQLAELIGLETDTLGLCYRNQTPSGHAKAVVKIDGTWYAVDPTWANGSRTSIEGTKRTLNHPDIMNYVSELTRHEEVNNILRSLGMEFNEYGYRTNLP